MGCCTQHWSAPCTEGSRAMTRKTGSDNKAIGFWLGPSIRMLEIG